jgi:hypothetical protein
MGHEHIRMDVAACAQCDLPQVLPVAQPVRVGEQARLPIIATLDDALREVDEIESWLARHGRVCAGIAPVFPRKFTRSVRAFHDLPSESAL